MINARNPKRVISAYESERRKLVAEAEVIMAEAMSKAPGLMYSEWLEVLLNIQAMLVRDLEEEDWRGENPAPKE